MPVPTRKLRLDRAGHDVAPFRAGDEAAWAASRRAGPPRLSIENDRFEENGDVGIRILPAKRRAPRAAGRE